MAFADQTTGGRIIKEGIRPVKITLSGAVKAGDLLGYSSGWVAADMNSSPKIYPELVASVTEASGAVITAFREAVVDFGSSCTATAGDRIYSSTDAGQYVGVASNDQGYCVGVMTTAQIAFVNPYYAFPLLKMPNIEYSNTSGTVTILQLKSALAATGTASITGIEVAPKVLDAIAAGTVRGIYTAVDLEGTSAGTITAVTGVESNIGSDSGTSRTVTSARCFLAVNNLHGTCTNGINVIEVSAAGGVVGWNALALLPDTTTGLASVTNGTTLADISGTTNAGWIKVVVGSTTRYIALYALKAS